MGHGWPVFPWAFGVQVQHQLGATIIGMFPFCGSQLGLLPGRMPRPNQLCFQEALSFSMVLWGGGPPGGRLRSPYIRKHFSL